MVHGLRLRRHCPGLLASVGAVSGSCGRTGRARCWRRLIPEADAQLGGAEPATARGHRAGASRERRCSAVTNDRAAGQALDPSGARGLHKPLQQRRPDPPPLPGVCDDDRDAGEPGIARIAHIARDPDSGARHRVECDKRLVVGVPAGSGTPASRSRSELNGTWPVWAPCSDQASRSATVTSHARRDRAGSGLQRTSCIHANAQASSMMSGLVFTRRRTMLTSFRLNSR